MATILICGVNGFVGRHLSRAFKTAGHTVHGIERDGQLAEELSDTVARFIVCDLTDAASVQTLDLSEYSAIVNLAGLANVGASFDDPDLYLKINVDAIKLIGQEAWRQKARLRLVAVSTGAVYENQQPLPLTEDSKTTPASSPYAKSKLAMEAAVEKLRAAGLDAVVVRPFNHIGPGQRPGFIVPDLYAGLLTALKNNTPLPVGNLETKRDYTDVRDVVRAYVLLATADTLRHSVYNVCSGHARSGQEILRALQAQVPGSDKLEIEVDQSRVRPTDPMELYGSAERLNQDTGWQPEIPLTKTIADFVADA